MRLFRFVALSVCLLGVVCVIPATADAQRNPLIAEGQSMYDDLRYEEALQTLSAGLVRSGNSEQERATIYRLLALTYLSLGRSEEAEGAYRSLLGIEPEFDPGDNVSPRFREFFSGVRERWEADGRPGVATAPPTPIEIVHASPAQADPGAEIPLTATIQDPQGRVSGLVLAYRQGTSDVFRRLDCDFRDGAFVAVIPGEDVAPPLVEYYFEAVDGAGLPVAARGDVAAPLRIAVEGPSNSVLTKWWFWTIAVVVIGGAVTTAVLLTRDDGAPPSQGTLIVNIN